MVLRRRRDDRGAAAVEFALVVPILLMLTFAIISFGWLFAQDLALRNASWQTARYSVVENRTCAEIRTEAVDAAKPLVALDGDLNVKIERGIEGGSLSSACSAGPGAKPCEGSPDKTNIYVTLNYDADILIPVIPGMGDSANIDGRGVFRCEWS